VALSLHRFMHVKIKNTQRFDFFYLSIIISNEKISLAYFQKPKSFIPISFDINPIVRVEEFHTNCDLLRQFLGICGCFPHFIDDFFKAIGWRLEIVLA